MTAIRQRKQGLAPPASRFIGRASDLASLGDLFARGSRLVTLWGPAGMGKTRLATELALAWPSAHAGEDARFCELAAARDLDSVCRAVALVVGAQVAPPARAGARSRPKDPVEAIGAALAAEGPLLLVLDNLEQVLESAAPALDRWLHLAPEARFLVTSRERTRLPGEVTYELTPLGLPAAGSAPLASEAAELFLDRARAERPALTVGPDAARAIAEVVRRLEGIPLAIELAAARFELLGAEGLLSRLESSLSILSGGIRRAEARQATLRSAIAWSWDLLDEPERSALARCSVFRGSFTLDAASAVLGVPDALDLVQSLRDKSLLRAAPGERTGGSRMSLYEGVRELAAEKLVERGERAEAEERRAAHFLSTGEAAAREVERSGSLDALNRVALDLDNLIAVADVALEAPSPSRAQAERALSALLVADPVLTTRGPFGAHLERLDRALAAAAQAGADPLLETRALAARGRAENLRGLEAAGVADLERARAQAAALGAAEVEAGALTDLGVHHHRRRAMDQARACYESALALHRRSESRRAEARVLGNLGAVHHDERRFDDAMRHYELALAIFASVGDARLEGIFSTNAGLLEQERGEGARARRRYERAAAILEEVGDPRLLGITLGNLGVLHHEEGRLDEARACHERAAALLRDAGDRRSEGMAESRLGAVLAALDRPDEARRALLRGERIAEQIGDELAVALARLCGGFLDIAEALREPRPDQAAACLASARAKIADAREGSPSYADRLDDIRLMLRILEPSLAALGPTEPAERALLVAPDARWCRPPGADWQDLRERHAVRRILVALVTHRRDAPGQGLALPVLKEVGWPGERILASAASNRVHVALNQLRKIGLKAWIQRGHEGYFLDPTLPVHHVAIDPGGPGAARA